jgi:hypothetical protein
MANKVIKVPSGQSVTLKDLNSFKHKDRKKILSSLGDGEISVGAGIKLLDGMISALIEGWTFELSIPSVDPNSLDELSIEDYDAIAKEAEQVQAKLFPRFSTDSGDQNSPKDS